MYEKEALFRLLRTSATATRIDNIPPALVEEVVSWRYMNSGSVMGWDACRILGRRLIEVVVKSISILGIEQLAFESILDEDCS